MQDKYITILNSNVAAVLARKNPVAFEQYRLNAIEALIANAPERTRLHLSRLHWRLKQMRKRTGSTRPVNNPHIITHSLSSPSPKAKVLTFSRSGDAHYDSDNKSRF